MKLKNCTVQELAEIGNEKRIFCFGASFMPQEICEEYGEYGFEDKFDYFVDNSPQKQGTVYRLQGKEIQVLSVNELISAITDNDLILITSKYYVEIYEQLEQVPELEEVSCYVWPENQSNRERRRPDPPENPLFLDGWKPDSCFRAKMHRQLEKGLPGLRDCFVE